jgi:dethiobiotin synthetase
MWVNGYFVTGTDTSVGKTYVTCALARRALAQGHKVFAFKPIESGCGRGPDGELYGSDQDLLAEAAGGWQHGPLRGLYRFPLPAAPFVAAEAAQTTIDVAQVVQTAHRGATDSLATLTLVEGAGGWRVPVTADSDMSTLARALTFPVLVVARAGLGTINHTLLTIEAIHRDGLPLAGVVLSRRAEDDLEATESNRIEINRRWPGRVLVLGADFTVLDCLLQAPGMFHVEHRTHSLP